MRAMVMLLTLSLTLILAVPGEAQQFMLGAPRNLQFKPVDTSRAMQPPNLQGFVPRTATPSPGFSLTNLFRKISLPVFGSKVPATPILMPQQNPIQPYQPQGPFAINPSLPKGKSIFDFAISPVGR